MKKLDSQIQERINNWLDGSYDDEAKANIREKLENKQYEELTEAFYKDLEFGTGGIRGIMGIGPNRVNKYTFGKATQGFSNYLNKQHPDEQISVAIAHDCRNNSETLAQTVANIFTANDIKVYLFDGLRPTPELSFAIRELGCQGGVMLTASHNPKEYNGYKAYNAEGGQLVAPHDQQVMDEVSKIADVEDVQFDPQKELISSIGETIDQQYLDAIKEHSVSPDAIERQKDLSIVFSPIHGTSGVMAPPALEKYGFENVHLVEEQMTFDGDFPTVEYPNPEEEEALSMALQKAKDIDGELVMATDPDADRVGIAVRNNRGELQLLNGNQTGTLLINYLLNRWEEGNKLTGSEYIVKTIVTTYLLDDIAEGYSVDCYNTLTGFKYIGELMTNLEDEQQFIVGGEESYGYLIGDDVRDKDAIVSVAMIAEMAAYYKDQGSSLYEKLLDIYEEYGYYRERLVAVYKRGRQGEEQIQQMIQDFREQPPQSLGGSDVVTVKDYQSQEQHHLLTGETTATGLPASNVLQFVTSDGSMVSVRPSGTEPKIKFYCSVNDELANREAFDEVTQQLEEKIDRIVSELGDE